MNFYASQKTAFFSTILVGVLTHGYMMFNKITNHDNLPVLYGCGDGLSLGRWMWSVWRGFDSLDNPLVNGLINLLLMAACVMLLVRIFSVRSIWIAASMGALWVSFPANTSLFFYGQLIPIYSIGIFLSVLAVYFFHCVHGWKKYLLFSACVVMSLGCYQAYFAITATCLMFLLLKYVYSEQRPRKLISRGLSCLASLIASLLLYGMVTKFICSYCQVNLTDYQGLSSIKIPSIPELLPMVTSAYFSFFHFNASIQPALVSYIMDLLLPLFFFLGALYLLIKLIQVRQYFSALYMCLLVALFPVACNLTYLYGADFVYSLMLYANVFLPIAVLVFAEMLMPIPVEKALWIKRGRELLYGVMFLLVLQNGLLANQEYYAQQRAQIVAFGYLHDVITQIKNVNGYTQEMPVALVGFCSDPDIRSIDLELYRRANLGSTTTAEAFVNATIYQDWLRPGTFKNWIGFSGRFLSKDESFAFLERPDIQAMPNYPNDGSVAVVDGVVVVHFSSN